MEAPCIGTENLAVVDQLHHDKAESEELALAAMLPRSTALKPFHMLSSGERAQAELARQPLATQAQI